MPAPGGRQNVPMLYCRMVWIILYYSLLVLWVFLPWPALRLQGKGRIWVLVVAALGLCALLYEFWFVFIWSPTVSAPIRLDIPLISIVLVFLYATAVMVLYVAKRQKIVTVLTIALVLICGSMTYKWISIGRQVERMSEIAFARQGLLFNAKFRSRDTYESFFGLAGGSDVSHPTGHWEAQSHEYYSRLVINPEGRVWLFFRCGEAECNIGPGGSRLQEIPDRPGQWKAGLERPGGGIFEFVITEKTPGGLSTQIRGYSVTFVKAPPPIAAEPQPEALKYLGPFVRSVCLEDRTHAYVRQLWLWREEERLYAVGVFATPLAGKSARFSTPMVMGEGARTGDGWSFAWQQDGKPWSATIALAGPDVVLTLKGEGREADREVIGPGAIFRHGAIELAPLTAKADWDKWFNTILIGYRHFTSADIPAC